MHKSRGSGWRSNFGFFANNGGMTSAYSNLSPTQFPNTGFQSIVTGQPTVAGTNSAGTIGSGSSPTAGTGF